MLMNGNAILHCFELHKVNHHSSYCCSRSDSTDQQLRVSGKVICKKNCNIGTNYNQCAPIEQQQSNQTVE